MNPIIFFLLPTKTYISIIWVSKPYISHMEAYKTQLSHDNMYENVSFLYEGA